MRQKPQLDTQDRERDSPHRAGPENRSSFAKVLEIARHSCGFAQPVCVRTRTGRSDQLNLQQIWAQILPSYFLPGPYDSVKNRYLWSFEV